MYILYHNSSVYATYTVCQGCDKNVVPFFSYVYWNVYSRQISWRYLASLIKCYKIHTTLVTILTLGMPEQQTQAMSILASSINNPCPSHILNAFLLNIVYSLTWAIKSASNVSLTVLRSSVFDLDHVSYFKFKFIYAVRSVRWNAGEWVVFLWICINSHQYVWHILHASPLECRRAWPAIKYIIYSNDQSQC